MPLLTLKEIDMLGLFILVNAVCFIIMVLIFVTQRKYLSHSVENICYEKLLILVAIICVLNIIFVVFDNYLVEQTFIRYVICLLQIAFLDILAILYIKYTCTFMGYSKRKINIISYILIGISTLDIILAFSSFWNTDYGYFIVREYNGEKYIATELEMGKLYFLHVIFNAIVLIYGSSHILISGIKSNDKEIRRQNIVIFTTLLLLFSIVLVVYIFDNSYLIALLTPLFTLSLVYNYIIKIGRQVSIDALTKLPNRHGLYNDYRLLRNSHNEHNYILITDINYFKNINDNFGHLEGDTALKTTVRLLEEEINKVNNDGKIYRYGGDEFVIIMRNMNNITIEKFIENITNAFDEYNNSSNKLYKLTIAIGYCHFNKENHYFSIDKLISEADKLLYENKKIAKSN